ncbi:MAG: dynamin family protein [Gammaproteobacteria bacterium]|nr:dynamin family protein [Gammaproteobacteria bacterium]MBU1416332.1 dynamin family protein [Gammaproteobacteria bacterium]
MTLARQFDAYRAWRDDVRQLAGRLQSWLAEGELLDSQAEQQLRRIRDRLDEDKLVVAFVAEFSRGKSELINALFFADRGGRVLPSSAGRTTMCPTEISWDKSLPPRISLLPIETRAEGASISDLRSVPEAWENFPFDPEMPDGVTESLRRVGDTKLIAAADALGLGFTIGNGSDGSLVANRDGQVEIPRWRHAMINFPHPLLEQGLVVLDTPGLNAIGAEPELTLSLLPSAHAVLFILAADTGVTQTDLAVWRDHVGSGSGRLVVLNKIDGLWDGLRTDEVINAEIQRQVESCGRTLGLPASSVFAVSAQKGLVAKIERNEALLEKSRLPLLEDALAEGLLPAKQDIVARVTAAEARQMAGEARQLLMTRRAALGLQLDELATLRGKNESMVAQMVGRAQLEKETYEKGLREYYAVRSVYTRLSETLFSHLGLEALRAHARQTRETMRQARFTRQLLTAMGELFAAAGECLDTSENDISEISMMMSAMRDRFGKAYGVSIDSPVPFSLAMRRRQLNHLEVAARRQYGSVIRLLTSDKRTLTQQFFETIVSQIRRIFDHANRDADHWLRALMSPLENQVREVQRQMRHRLDNVRRIYEAAEGLEDRIEELTQERTLLDDRLKELAQMETALDQTLRPPNAAPIRAAA